MTPETAVEACLVLVCAALPLSIAGMNLALGLLTAAVLFGFSSHRLRWRPQWTPAVVAAAAYAAAGLLCSAASPTPDSSLQGAVKDWHRLWALTVLLPAFSVAKSWRAARGLAVGFSCAALVGLWQGAAAHAATRAHAFVHPVTYGEMLSLMLLGGLCLWGRREAELDMPRGKSVGVSFLILIGAALVLNQTRGAVLGLAAGFAAACWYNRELRRWIPPAIGGSVAVAAVWEVLPTGRPLSALLNAELYTPAGALNPQLARWRFWSVAWRAFRDHPLFGVGPGNYGAAFESYTQGSSYSQIDYGSAHNLYLHQLAERGLLGAASLAFLLWTLTSRALKRARREPVAWNLWAWGAAVAFLVMNGTEVALQSEMAATFFLLIWSWAEANNSYN